MTISLETADRSDDQPFDVAMHDVRCLVKRHAYELAFTFLHSPHDATADEIQVRLYVHVKLPCLADGFVLPLRDLDHFYEDLLQMLEYWHTERRKIAMTRRVFSGRHAGILADVR